MQFPQNCSIQLLSDIFLGSRSSRYVGLWLSALGPVKNFQALFGGVFTQPNHGGGFGSRPASRFPTFGQICPNLSTDLFSGFCFRLPLTLVGEFRLDFLEPLIFPKALDFRLLSLAIGLLAAQRQETGERFRRHFTYERPLGGQGYISTARNMPRTVVFQRGLAVGRNIAQSHGHPRWPDGFGILNFSFCT